MSYPSIKQFGKGSASALIACVFLFFLFMRIYRLGYHDLWYDEYNSFLCTGHFWLRTPPLYYAFLFLWVRLFGVSEFALRFPSVIFSILSIYLLYLLGRRLFEKKAGLWAAAIMGFSPFHLWYAQEARSYSMILFLSLASTLFLLKAQQKEKWIYWVIFAFISAAGLLAHYFYILLIFSQFLFILLAQKRKGIFIIGALSIGIGLLFIPHLPLFFSRYNLIRNGGYWIDTPDWQSVLFTFENLLLGYHGTTLLYGASNLLCLTLFIFSLKILKDKRRRDNYLFCILLFLVPLLAAFIFSKLVFSVYLDRGFIVITPYYYIILSVAVISMPKKLRLLLSGAFIALFLIADYRYFKDEMIPSLKHHNGAYIKKRVKPLARFLNENLKENEDTLVFTNLSGLPVMAYCRLGASRPLYIFYPGSTDGDTKRPYLKEERVIPCHRLRDFNFKCLWLIASDWSRSGDLDENSRLVKNWLDKNFVPFFSRDFGGIWLLGYKRNKTQIE